MARPPKIALSYFPLETGADQDRKIRLLEAAHPQIGWLVWTKLLMEIYGERGYWIPWEKDERLLLADRCKCSENDVSGVVSSALNVGLFSRVIYEEFGILTSRRIQEVYLEVCKKRSTVKFYEEILLIEVSEEKTESLFDYRKGFRRENPQPEMVFGELTLQRKQNKTKQNKREREGNPEETPLTLPEINFISFGKWVRLKPLDLLSTIRTLGASTAKYYISNADDYLDQKTEHREKYADHFRLIRKFQRTDEQERRGPYKNGGPKGESRLTEESLRVLAGISAHSSEELKEILFSEFESKKQQEGGADAN